MPNFKAETEMKTFFVRSTRMLGYQDHYPRSLAQSPKVFEHN